MDYFEAFLWGFKPENHSLMMIKLMLYNLLNKSVEKFSVCLFVTSLLKNDDDLKKSFLYICFCVDWLFALVFYTFPFFKSAPVQMEICT